MIVTEYGNGKSMAVIAEEIGCSKSTVHLWLTRMRMNQDLRRSPGSGRRRKLTPSEQNEVILKIKRDPQITARDIRAELGRDDVSLETIRSHIREHGEFGSYWPFISAANRKKRVKWCKAHKEWTKDMWRAVLWSDESPFVLRYHAKKRIWRRHNERYYVKALKGTIKHDVTIMVWG
jgi:hypothetical protein